MRQTIYPVIDRRVVTTRAIVTPEVQERMEALANSGRRVTLYDVESSKSIMGMHPAEWNGMHALIYIDRNGRCIDTQHPLPT